MAFPKLREAVPLPLLPAEPRCPAAAAIDGVSPERSGIVCGVIANDVAKEDGVGMNPAQFAVARSGGDGDVFLTLRGDPSTVARLCCGDGLPVMDERGHYARDSYTFCPVWQAEKQRIEAGRDQLAGGGVEETTAHYDSGAMSGLNGAPAGSTYAADDPWSQARRDLDVLAPQGS